MPSAAVNALKKASKGLLYPSESDEPFEVVQIPAGPNTATSQDAVRQLAGGRKIVPMTPDQFFASNGKLPWALKKTALVFLLVKRRASPERPSPLAWRTSVPARPGWADACSL